MTEQGSKIIQKMVEEPDRESSAGFHFISYYIENPYGWYLRYIRGYRTKFTKPALLMGSALHSGCELMYRTWAKEDVMSAFTAVMKHSKAHYEDLDQYAKDLEDGQAMLSHWANKWLDYDRTHFNVLHVEEKFAVPLPNGQA
jgi:hypothetical protein